MLRNKKFGGYAIAFCILGVVFMFLYSGLQNDQINIIQSFSGWTETATQLPMTVGNFVCIALTFVFGTLFIRFGVRKTLLPCIVLSALGCVGIALADGLVINGGEGNYALFWVSLFVVRCTCMCLQMAGFQMCASWFIRYRGRIMGIITVGSPLFSVVGTAGMTTLIQNNFGGDYRPFYYGIAALLVIVGVLTMLLLRDKPEDVGLYPDGSATPPKSKGGEGDEVRLSVGQVLRESKAWKLIVSYGAFTFIINACMGSMVVRYISLALPDDPAGPIGVWLVALKWLAMGAILGIPMSYVFGYLDDKLGSVKTSIVLGLCELIPVLCLMFMPVGGNTALMILWGFGVACMTGGVPTMHPCIVGYCYGRREYQSANRIIMSIQLIPSAFAAMMMTVLISGGNAIAAYVILLAVIAIGLIATFTMPRIPDACLADRDYSNKA